MEAPAGTWSRGLWLLTRRLADEDAAVEVRVEREELVDDRKRAVEGPDRRTAARTGRHREVHQAVLVEVRGPDTQTARPRAIDAVERTLLQEDVRLVKAVEDPHRPVQGGSRGHHVQRAVAVDV